MRFKAGVWGLQSVVKGSRICFSTIIKQVSQHVVPLVFVKSVQEAGNIHIYLMMLILEQHFDSVQVELVKFLFQLKVTDFVSNVSEILVYRSKALSFYLMSKRIQFKASGLFHYSTFLRTGHWLKQQSLMELSATHNKPQMLISTL